MIPHLLILLSLMSPLEIYKFKVNRSRSSSALKSGIVTLKVDRKVKYKDQYGEIYPTIFKGELKLVIYGKIKNEQIFDLPVDFFDYEFLEKNLEVGVIRYPDFNFRVRYKVNNCFAILMDDIEVVDVDKAKMKILTCPRDKDLGIRKIDIYGKYQGKVEFKAGFDRM